MNYLTQKQILDELEEKRIAKKFKIKTRYSKMSDMEEYSPDRERIQQYANQFFNSQNGTALPNHRY